jgi:tetratricopeptide (TPR) repeat protein
MGNHNFMPQNNIAGKNNGEGASGCGRDVVRRRSKNIQMVQNVLLIWLDNNMVHNSVDYQKTITELRCVVNTIKTYMDSAQCIQFIERMGDEKACILISGSLGQHVVPCIHNMSQVHSIFIFCSDRTTHEQWAKEWPKIKGVFIEIAPICKALKQAVNQCEQNAIRISMMPTSDDVSKQNLDQLEPSFMYTQILKEILLTIEFEQVHFTEFIKYCRSVFAENEGELENITKLESKYRDETPIWWYTYKRFLHPMLNRALRQMNVEIIIRMGFFISDLHRHIERLYKEQFNDHHSDNSFTVYRGQGMSKTDFEQMRKNKGGLTSFNSFLSTSKNSEVPLDFAHDAATNPDLVGILFVMTIDRSKSRTPFACITNVAYHKDTDEILFSMHTVFRICEIKPMDENHRLFQVDLTLTSDTDKDLCMLTDRIREETFPQSKGWYRLGLLLLKMGQFDGAQQIYEMLLDQITDDSEKASIYNQLGRIKYNQGEYQEAIGFYEKSLEIDQKTLPLNHPDLACSYGDIGNVYLSMGEYRKALSYHDKALIIRQKSLPPNHTDLASSYNNIGEVHRNMREYPKALIFYDKSVEIKQKSLPSNHPSLGSSYNNIGNVYYNTGEYAKALSSYEKALEIFQKCLPPNHPDLATCYDNIALVHENMGDYSKASSFYKHALDIGQHVLPANHPNLQQQQTNFDRVKKKL